MFKLLCYGDMSTTSHAYLALNDTVVSPDTMDRLLHDDGKNLQVATIVTFMTSGLPWLKHHQQVPHSTPAARSDEPVFI